MKTRIEKAWLVDRGCIIHNDVSYDKKRDNIKHLLHHEISVRIDQLEDDNEKIAGG